MNFRDFMRLIILGDPIAIPNTNEILKLFKWEIKNKITFSLFLLFTAGMIIVTLIFIKGKLNKQYALFAVGFSIVYCAFILQRSKTIGKLLRNKEGGKNKKEPAKSASGSPDTLKSGKNNKSSSLLGLLTPTLLSNKEYPIEHIESKNMKNNGGKIYCQERSKDNITSENDPNCEKNMQFKVKIKDPKGKRIRTTEIKKQDVIVKNMPYVDKNVSIDKIEDDQNDLLKNQKKQFLKTRENAQKYNEDDVNGKSYSSTDLLYLEDLIEIFKENKGNNLKLKIFLSQLKEIEKKINNSLLKFDTSFKQFMEFSSKIENEMIAFNASPKYFDVEYKELKEEIFKYFSLLKDQKKIIYNETPMIYLENILEIRKILDDKTKSSTLKTARIESHLKYLKYFVYCCCFVFICLFIGFVVEISFIALLAKPLTCIFISLLFIANVAILLNAQIMDRNCKIGKIEGCMYNLRDSNNYMDNLRRMEFMMQSDVFKRDLEESFRDSKTKISFLRNYYFSLITERVSYKILVFNNLFDKIFFVKDDFKSLTKDKVDELIFYDKIRRMSSELEKIQNELNLKIKLDVVDILLREKQFSYFLEKQRDFISTYSKSIVLGKEQTKNKKKVKDCIKVLKDLCRSKDYLDEIFLITFVFVLVLVILIFL